MVDQERAKAIAQISPPSSKKAMQSFIEKINLLRKFLLDFTQIVKPLQGMIKKNTNFKWNSPKKEAFDNIKQAIAEAPTLHSPDFSKGFILYTFTSDSSIAAILTQKDDNSDEQPISFMSARLQGAKMNYLDIEK